MDKWVPHGNTSAHDWSGLSVVEVVWDLEDEGFVDGVRSRVSSKGLGLLVSSDVSVSLLVVVSMNVVSLQAVLLISLVAEFAV